MRPRMTVLAAVTMALGLGLAGCGQQARDADDSVTPGARALSDGPGLSESEIRHEDATTAWAGHYCDAVSNLVHAFSRMPDIDPSSPERTADTSSRLLGVMIDGLDHTVTELDRLERAPIAAGDKLRTSAVTTYNGIRDQAVGAKRQLDAADGEQAQRIAVGSVRAPLEKIGKLNLLDGFNEVSTLRKAATKAPSCQELTSKGSPTISSTAPRS